jgi:hypothetical protein
LPTSDEERTTVPRGTAPCRGRIRRAVRCSGGLDPVAAARARGEAVELAANAPAALAPTRANTAAAVTVRDFTGDKAVLLSLLSLSLLDAAAGE